MAAPPCRIILCICVLLAVLLRVFHHMSKRSRCLGQWRDNHRCRKERWNARLNAWVRGRPEAQTVSRSPSDASDKLGASAQASPRVDDATLIAELRRVLRLVESRSSGDATGEAAC